VITVDEQFSIGMAEGHHMPTASIPPSDFVDRLIDPGLSVDGYSKPVSLARYLCSNEGDGGNKKAQVLQNALPTLVAGTADAGVLAPLQKSGEYYQLFSGQGKPDHFRTVMAVIWRNKDKLKADSRFAKYFADSVPNTLQAMVDDDLFGMDCIGFFGRYLEAAGIFSNYRGAYPRQWLDIFLPVRTPFDIDVCGAIVWANGTHIAIIDSCEEANWHATPPHIVVNICQSSNSKTVHGPQINYGVKLVRLNAASALDIAKYNQELAKKDDNGKVITLSEADKAKLRASLTSTVATGYRGGIFFDVQQGDPAPPVRGTVYIGLMPNLTLRWLVDGS
jgi:hypothetical protein